MAIIRLTTCKDLLEAHQYLHYTGKMKIMKRLYTTTLFIFTIIGCKDQIKEDPSKIMDGVYIGTFTRTPAWQLSQSSNVTISFSENVWSGLTDKVNFPILGEGTYKIDHEIISFKNISIINSDSDTTLLLSGDFQFRKTNTVIEFYRFYYNPSWGWDMPDEDHYTLVKK